LALAKNFEIVASQKYLAAAKNRQKMGRTWQKNAQKHNIYLEEIWQALKLKAIAIAVFPICLMPSTFCPLCALF
jgi:hypothetical protein